MISQVPSRAPDDELARVRSVEFYSSVEYASFQPALVRELEIAGWATSQRFGVSQADYWNARSRFGRWLMRAQTYGMYPVKVAARFARNRGTVGVVCTNTFFAPWLAEVAAGRRGVPVVHWVFDLFPDVLVLAGKIGAGSLTERVLRRCVRSTLDRAAANVFLGERLRAFAEERFGPIPRSVVIPVGCDARPFRNAPPAARSGGAPVRVLYCGNLGRMHDVTTFAQALQDGLPAGIDFEFRGNGAGFRELGEAVRFARLGDRVRIASHLPDDEWAAAMRAADVALVTIRPGAEGLVMPSKTYSALAAGQAVLAICPRASDLADTVLAHDCGWVVEPGDSAGMRRVLEQLVADPGEVLRRRRNAWHAGQEIYDQRNLARPWISVLESALTRARR
jgi:glycosyltransferase involved in cell wall biosynthesis